MIAENFRCDKTAAVLTADEYDVVEAAMAGV